VTYTTRAAIASTHSAEGPWRNTTASRGSWRPRQPVGPAAARSPRRGGSAHILQQKREAKLVRPAAQYIGPASRTPDQDQVEGWAEIARP
jgi:hypothetical protein